MGKLGILLVVFVLLIEIDATAAIKAGENEKPAVKAALSGKALIEGGGQPEALDPLNVHHSEGNLTSVEPTVTTKPLIAVTDATVDPAGSIKSPDSPLSAAYEGGEKDARLKAVKTEAEASARTTRAREETTLGQDIERRTKDVADYAVPRAQSNDPDVQNDLREKLAAPINPSPNYRKIYGDLDLNVNQDLLEKGPRYSQNLFKAAKAESKLAQELLASAKKAVAAAEKMNSYKDQLQQDTTDLKSLGDKGVSTQGKPVEHSGITGAAPVAGGGSRAGANSLVFAGAGTNKKNKFSETEEKNQAGITSSDKGKKKAGGKDYSLRNRLLSALGRTNSSAEGTSSESSAQNSATKLTNVSSKPLFGAESGPVPLMPMEKNLSSLEPSDGIQSRPSFIESSSLMKSMESAAREGELENEMMARPELKNTSLFERVKKTLDNCEAHKCVNGSADHQPIATYKPLQSDPS